MESFRKFVFSNTLTMQFKKNFHFLILSTFLFIFPNLSTAQEIEYNRHGERIVKFPSGKWEYYDESKPLHRAIWKEFQKENEVKENFLDEQTAKGSDSNQLRYEVLLEEAEEVLALAMEEESDAKFSKILLEEELDEIRDNENSSDAQYKAVKKQLKLAAKLEKRAKRKRKEAEKNLKKLKKNKGEKSVKKKSRFANLKGKKNRKTKAKKKAEHIENQAIQNSTFAYREDAAFISAAKRFKKYKVEEDVMYNPPLPDCNLVFDGMDEFMGKKRKDVKRDLFFTHTEDDMRRYMKDDEYITCEGNLTQIQGGVLLFNMFISINTNDAKRSFGELKKGSIIVIKMIDGTNITLANNQADGGTFDPLTRKHTYTAQYMVNSGQEKKLKKGEVDLVRIIWETGYEDYEVYNLDFFRNQFRCLNK